MTAAFPGAAVFGCTTAGEIISGQMLKNSIVAMAFNAGVIKDVQVEVLAHVHGQAAAGVPRVFADFKKHYGTAMGEADPHQYFGIILVDGLSGAEEGLMVKLGALTVEPDGLMAGRESYLRSVQRVEGDSLFFYCAVDEIAKLQVRALSNIVEYTRTALSEDLSHVKHIHGIVNFHCILRTLELEK